MRYCFITLLCCCSIASPSQHPRFNQVGYLPSDEKRAIAMSHTPLEGRFAMLDEAGAVVFQGSSANADADGWGPFAHYYVLDFSDLRQPGTYLLRWREALSAPFRIAADAYGDVHEDLLVFMRQQRCGYNPHLDRVCYWADGRSFYGPMPDSTYVDVSGGWHDAGDQLKYLITGSFAAASMLYASIFNSLRGLALLRPDKFAEFQNDHVVYHDDIGDYSTNEPTMDGTAGAILPMAFFAAGSVDANNE
jgi:endoglucanase